MKKLLVVLIVLALAVAGIAFYVEFTSHGAPAEPRRDIVDRGDISEKVSANGKIVISDVAYVSTDVPAGRVVEIAKEAEAGLYVKAGQLLVRLDDELARAKLAEAKAAVKAAEALKAQAEAKLKTANSGKTQAEAKLQLALKAEKAVLESKDLATQGLRDIRRQEVVDATEGVNFADAQIKEAESAILSAEANIEKAKAGVSSAEQAIKMLEVTAPVSGTIIDKRVTSKGQLISAQVNPILFVIAPDLNRLEMHAQVGEQDIAKVTKKMKGTFKVDAYTEENVEFLGEVTEIAFVPTTSPIRAGDFTSGTGPVTYTVTLKVLPSKNLETHPLKSGLTANVDLMVREVKHVLRVPNLALNFLPDNPTAEENRRRSERATTNWKPLWVWKGNGVREMIFVQTGANDGNRTEIKEIDGQLTEGMEVIVENPPRPENSGGLFNLPRLKVL